MKHIQLATYPEGEPQHVTNLKGIIENPGEKGFVMSEMHPRLKILAALEACEKNDFLLKLEDAEFALLKQYYDATMWGTVHENLVALDEAMNNPQDA